MTQSNLDPSRSSDPEIDGSSPLDHDDRDRHSQTPNTSSDDKNLDPETHKHLRELKWSELISRQDAYRFYIKLILGVNAFYYATTGAVLLFYFRQDNNHWEFFSPLPTDDYYREFFLLLPILMGTVLGGFLIYARALHQHNSEIIEHIRVELDARYDMEIQLIPDSDLLGRLLLVFGILFFIVAGSISLVQWLRSSTSFFILGLFIILPGLAISLVTGLCHRRRTNKGRSRLKEAKRKLLLRIDEKKDGRKIDPK